MMSSPAPVAPPARRQPTRPCGLGLRIAFGVLCATLLAGPAAAQPKGGKPPGRPPSPVVVEVAEQRNLAPVTWYSGTVISRNQARISPEIDGRLVWVAEVGDRLNKGDEIARLDGVLLERQLAENRAAITREKARLAFLEAEVVRLQRLVKNNTTTRSQFEEAVAERGVTRSELAAAQARADLTAERLQRTAIKAPFAGVVAERYLQGGEWADNGEAIIRLVNTDEVEIQSWVPVQSLDFVQQGSELAVRSNPHDVPAEVRTIVPVGDQRSRLYELRLAPGKGNWTVGRSVRVAIPTGEAKTVVAVPRDALVLRRSGTAVFRISEDNKAERVAVETGIASGPFIEVTGINAGDKVVTRGGERLRPGQAVAPRPPNP